jgi:aminopeptidase
VDGGGEMDGPTLIANGINQSLIHIDWMIGSGDVDVDGVTRDGAVEPVMRRGAWV